MARLRDTISIEGSARQTREALERLFAGLRDENGSSHVRLRVPISRRPNAPRLEIDREVNIEVRKGRETSSVRDSNAISWAPEGPVAFPSFEGMLAVSGDNETSRIELDGWYTQPFGAGGLLFDAALGHELAQATAREFLGDLRRAIENAPH